MLRNVTTSIVLAALSLALPGCDAPDNDGDVDTEFREYAFAADNDVEVHAGGTVEPECLAWEFADQDTYVGPETAGVLLWNVTGLGDEIFDINGQLLCTMTSAGPDYVELRQGATGAVLASQWHNHAFFGDVSSIPESSRWDYADYTFVGTHLAEGPAHGETVATVTEFIEYAQTKRKMAIAALVMGLCGSAGLPPPPAGS